MISTKSLQVSDMVSGRYVCRPVYAGPAVWVFKRGTCMRVWEVTRGMRACEHALFQIGSMEKSASTAETRN